MTASPPADQPADHIGEVDLAELKRLAKAATPGPWDHMKGRNMVRAIRGDLAIPLLQALEPHGDPMLAAPTCRVGKEVVFRANSQAARDSAAMKQEHRNAAYFAALSPATVLSLLSLIARQEETIRAAEAFIEDMGTDLHHARVADWYPEGANNAALQMSEDMRLAGNRCADYDRDEEVARLSAHQPKEPK